ncbi:MAG: hypothetical protein CMH57_08270 [Myxococcales bacterium]|nr:hypothetical protein [Myxococcales bacterium]
MNEAYEFLSKAGIIMIPILLCSIVGLALFMERLWALQRTHVIPSRFIQVVSDLVRKRQFERAQALCEGNDSSIAAVLAAGLRYAGRDRATIKEIMEEAGQREAASLERGVGVLGSIANLAPLLGLLGTVTGMIKVFQQVVNQVGSAGGGQVNAGALANGIWEALLSTAAGLTVAIPAFVMYKYLTSRVDQLLVEMEERSLELADAMVALDKLPTPRISAEQLGSPSDSDEGDDAAPAEGSRGPSHSDATITSEQSRP